MQTSMPLEMLRPATLSEEVTGRPCWLIGKAPRLQDELWLMRKVANNPRAIFDGISCRFSRRESLRAAIVARGLSDEPLGKKDTFRSAFERLYGEPLSPGDDPWSAFTDCQTELDRLKLPACSHAYGRKPESRRMPF